MSLLEIEDLVVHFHTDAGPVAAVDGVSLSVEAGEIVGLVGESGIRKVSDGACASGADPAAGTDRAGRGAVRGP